MLLEDPNEVKKETRKYNKIQTEIHIKKRGNSLHTQAKTSPRKE